MMHKNDDAEQPVDINETDIVEEVYIHNAGLVIISPFIPALFRKSGYMNVDGFISDVHLNKGIRLLEFLATGNDAVLDIDLSLNKILCGADPEAPLIGDSMPGQAEKDLVNGLLESVIAQWAILGDTSVNGLRGAFFVRNGKLTEPSGSFNLLVEKAGYDMLLDHLPWVLSPIKFSWMPKDLFVTWR